MRVALNRNIELAGHHGFESALHGVDRNDDDVAARLHAGGFDRLNGTNRHVVVVCVKNLDILVGLEEGFHDFLALGAGEVTGLRAGDLEARISLDHFFKALLAVDGRCRTNGTLQFNDVHVTWLLVVIEQPLRRLLTFFCEVGTDHRDVK